MQCIALQFAVAQERTKSTGIRMVRNEMKQKLIELKCRWVLLQQVPNALQELEKHWREILGCRMAMGTSFVELVSKGNPLLANELAKPAECAIVRIKQ